MKGKIQVQLFVITLAIAMLGFVDLAAQVPLVK